MKLFSYASAHGLSLSILRLYRMFRKDKCPAQRQVIANKRIGKIAKYPVLQKIEKLLYPLRKKMLPGNKKVETLPT